MWKQPLCRLCVPGGFGRPVGAEWVLQVSRALAYQAREALGGEAKYM